MNFSPIWISLETAATATAITFFLGVAAARWMLAYRGKGRGLIDGLLLLPLVLPPTVVGFILLLLFGKNGPVGRLLLQLRATVVFSWPATVIAATVVAFPLMYRTTLAAFEQLDENIVQAARTLGASEFTLLRRVMLPLAWPGVMAATALAFARALGEFGATLMLAGNIPGRTQTLPLAIFFAAEAGELKRAVIWTLAVVSISLLVVAAIHYWSRYQRGPRAMPRRPKNEEVLPPPEVDPQEQLRINSSERPGRVGFASMEHGLPISSTSRDSLLSVDFEKHFPGFTLRVNFEAGGAPLAIIGGSGSGKTMTLRVITGLEKPRRGRIVLNGRVLFDSAAGIDLPCRERRIGFLFQNYALFPHLTVVQNMGFGMRAASKQERTQRISELMDLLHLRGLENRLPSQLSGGQAQRVALGRALAIKPQAIFLDEPLSALDSYLRSQVEMQLIEALENYRGATLYVTHNMEEAYRISKNLLVLSAGRQVACGAKEEIFRHPPSYAVARVTGCKNFSRARALSPDRVEAADWHCTLRVAQPFPKRVSYVGIRAHHISFSDLPARVSVESVASRKASDTTEPGRENAARSPEKPAGHDGTGDQENTFPCWLARTSETPFRVTLYLRLHAPSLDTGDYHLQAEMFKDKWAALKDRAFPWRIRLDPERVFLMGE